MKLPLLLLAALLVCFLLDSNAQYGTLDPSFGNGGTVTTDIAGADDKGASLAIQSDGKIVLSGFGYNGTNNDVALARYLDNGDLDSSFGANGKIMTPIGNGHDYGLSVKIQPNGKLVVGGYSHNRVNNDFAILRYNTDGTLDSTFGTDGIVTTAVGSYGDNANSIVLQPDGKIVAGGYSDTTTGDFFAVVRYENNGNLDAGFGFGGKVVTHIGLSDDQCNEVILQPDGKIIAAGYSYNGNDWDFAIVRYNTDGSQDSTFGTNGIVTTDDGNQDNMFYGVALQSDGKIVGGGWSGSQFASVRYNSDGSLDTTYGSGGIVTTLVGVSGDGDGVAIQSDGQIIVVGNAQSGTDYDFGLVRYNSDGSPDNTFGNAGIVTTPVTQTNDFCLTIAIQSDHKIVVAGFGGPNNGRDFALARYDAGPVGVGEVSAEMGIQVYPNPVQEQVYVQFDKTISTGTVLILSIHGELISEMPVKNQSRVTVDVRNLPAGIYIARIITGERLFCEKLVVRNR